MEHMGNSKDSEFRHLVCILSSNSLSKERRWSLIFVSLWIRCHCALRSAQHIAFLDTLQISLPQPQMTWRKKIYTHLSGSLGNQANWRRQRTHEEKFPFSFQCVDFLQSHHHWVNNNYLVYCSRQRLLFNKRRDLEHFDTIACIKPVTGFLITITP